MKRQTISKEWLQSLGITEVTDEGDIYKNGILLTQTLVTCKHKYGTDKQYKVVAFYDPAYYHEQKANNCKYKAGNRTLLVSRVVYAWKWGECPGNMDVDHIDNNSFNNNINNLQLLTRKQNLDKRSKTHQEIAIEYRQKQRG